MFLKNISIIPVTGDREGTNHKKAVFLSLSFDNLEIKNVGRSSRNGGDDQLKLLSLPCFNCKFVVHMFNWTRLPCSPVFVFSPQFFQRELRYLHALFLKSSFGHLKMMATRGAFQHLSSLHYSSSLH